MFEKKVCVIAVMLIGIIFLPKLKMDDIMNATTNKSLNLNGIFVD